MPYDKYPYELPPLPYPYDALEPYIDTKTMEIHHDKHFQTYINNLNKALEPYPELQKYPLPVLLKNAGLLPGGLWTAVINNGGGVYNHRLFFNALGPPKEGNRPTGSLLSAIERDFGSFEQFKQQMSESAVGVFGSGWTYLVRTSGGGLVILNTRNQYTPLPLGYTPVLLFDVWEHAYYLKYQNRRAEYIENLWNVINWDTAQALFGF